MLEFYTKLSKGMQHGMRKYFKIRIYLIIYLRTLYAFKQAAFSSLNKAKNTLS